MHACLMMLLATAPAGADAASNLNPPGAQSRLYEQAADELKATLQTGSLLFNEGDCLAIRVYTASPYTHVAIAVVDEEDVAIYDSMNGTGVRRQSLAAYLRSQSPDRLHVFHPRRPLTPEQGRELSRYLESQLGRPYAVQHHLTGQRCEGVHCAEYVTDALMAIERVHANRPARVSPASLVTGITQGDIYAEGVTLELTAPTPATPVAANRCHRLWIETKHCLASCCDQLSGWFLCR